mmetsp:Transcript_40911/g.80639  ORF Transcript_40911/g.80639 Transcript_40911/m.80639 type:complete len:95 (-) Transcript_40911:266-550(-)
MDENVHDPKKGKRLLRRKVERRMITDRQTDRQAERGREREVRRKERKRMTARVCLHRAKKVFLCVPVDSTRLGGVAWCAACMRACLIYCQEEAG